MAHDSPDNDAEASRPKEVRERVEIPHIELVVEGATHCHPYQVTHEQWQNKQLTSHACVKANTN